MNYIAYYPLATRRPAVSGLRLEHQQQIVQRFLSAQDVLLAEYMEVVSGQEQPQLQEAIDHVEQILAKQQPTKLLIAKLYRFSRSASFIYTLRESRVPFLAIDMPEANELTVNVMAMLADHERQAISERTQAALKAVRARGQQLGTPENLTDEARALGRAVIQQRAREHPRNRKAGTLALLLYQQGENYSEIARQLNGRGFTTRQQKAFTHVQVKRLIDRYQNSAL